MRDSDLNSGVSLWRHRALGVWLVAAAAALSACGGGGGGGGASSPPPPTYTIGGSISGLIAGAAGAGLVLANGIDTVSPAAGATAFTFGMRLATGGSYAVTVMTQPAGETCTPMAASGTVGSANVSSVQIACTVNTYPLSGTVDGYTGTGLALQNGTEILPLTSNTKTFAFVAVLPYGTAYAVSVRTQPTGQTCQVSNGSGVAGIGSAAIVVSCAGSAWTWLGGSKAPNALSVYGTKGIAASGNVPGARAAAAYWSDASGGLWMFGGYGNDVSNTGYLSDLWKYDPRAGLWAWMAGPSTVGAAGVYGQLGMPAAANSPGGRNYSVSWVDSTGSVWVFGGVGFAAGATTTANLNDLWKYDPMVGTWSWMSGASSGDAVGVYGAPGVAAATNVPGARQGASAWVDGAGMLWLFGGYGRDSTNAVAADLNDLWKFDPTALMGVGEWTWMGGSNIGNIKGTYSFPGQPGARRWSVAWTDASHKFWLFGGEGYDSTGNFVNLNDLWRYDPAVGTWTFITGSITGNAQGMYGTPGMAAANNLPGARSQAVGWHDSNGVLWLGGGSGYDSTGMLPSAGGLWSLNDLWKFDPVSGWWTFVSGATMGNALGVYGTQGMAAPSNVPGGRQVGATWVNANNTLWLFGGFGLDSIGTSQHYLNDLWFIVPL